MKFGKSYFDGGDGYTEYQDAEHFKETAKWIVKEFQPQTVFEIGCAKGFLVKALRDIGVKAYGCDISEYAISEAPEQVKDFLYMIDITNSNNINLPKYDLIISYDTFEHIPEENLDSVFEFMRNIGTRYYIKVGTVNTPDWEHDSTHITIKPLDFWQKKFSEAIWEESK